MLTLGMLPDVVEMLLSSTAIMDLYMRAAADVVVSSRESIVSNTTAPEGVPFATSAISGSMYPNFMTYTG